MEELSCSYHSYPRVFAVGHSSIAAIFEDDVLVEEKLDGSQFSFGIFDGEIRCRSKGAKLVLDAPEKMFVQAVESVKSRAHLLQNGWTYRGEYLQRPKHNVLAYSRIPENHIMIFDINTGHEDYLSHHAKTLEANRIGLEVVPKLYEGKVSSAEIFKGFLDRISTLGGQRIEGVVVKNYARLTFDGKAMMGKFVSEAFKEVHNGEFRANNPTNGDIIEQIIYQYKTPARWEKAVQHLREAGKLLGDPADIGSLMTETREDVLRECEAEIKDKLFQNAWPKIARAIVGGLPLWYKEKLVEGAFSEEKRLVCES